VEQAVRETDLGADMALTPDEVERRTFPIADWGYERGEVHKFLVEVAATLRYALHSSFPSVTVVAPPTVTTPAPTTPAPTTPALTPLTPSTGASAADLTGLGHQVDDVVRAAEALGASLRQQAEAEATEIKARAELEAADRRREAERAADEQREQARRVLLAAEQQAAALVADAEQRAQETLRGAVDQARARAGRIERRAERHAERVGRFEADVHERLAAARADLDRALDRLTGTADEPVLDLSTERPGVRTGSLVPDAAPTTLTDDHGPIDPAVQLMRAAVGRAVGHATGHDTTASPAAPLPMPDPAGGRRAGVEPANATTEV
jgi:DivIVA domain-containing protein